MRGRSAAHRAGGPGGGKSIVGGNVTSVAQRECWRQRARWTETQLALFAAVRRGESAAELDRLIALIKTEHRLRHDARAIAALARQVSRRLDIGPGRALVVADARCGRL